MLYPREDRLSKVLLYACRNCDHQEELKLDRVHRNEILTQPMYKNPLITQRMTLYAIVRKLEQSPVSLLTQHYRGPLDVPVRAVTLTRPYFSSLTIVGGILQ